MAAYMPIALAFLYFLVGLFFCGLLNEKDVPGLLILLWPFVFVLWILVLVYSIGQEINKRFNHER